MFFHHIFRDHRQGELHDQGGDEQRIQLRLDVHGAVGLARNSDFHIRGRSLRQTRSTPRNRFEGGQIFGSLVLGKATVLISVTSLWRCHHQRDVTVTLPSSACDYTAIITSMKFCYCDVLSATSSVWWHHCNVINAMSLLWRHQCDAVIVKSSVLRPHCNAIRVMSSMWCCHCDVIVVMSSGWCNYCNVISVMSLPIVMSSGWCN